ncbi:hypothetical protein [Streptomyces sp. NPDC093568]
MRSTGAWSGAVRGEPVATHEQGGVRVMTVDVVLGGTHQVRRLHSKGPR